MASLEPTARVRVACEMCRKRKRKCDGVKPSCFGCLSRRVECRYDLNRPPRSKRDAGYVTGLEDQIDLLRDELHRLEDLKSSSEDAGQELSPSLVQSNTDCGPQRGKEESFVPFEASLEKVTPIQDVSSMIWRMSIEDSGEQAFIGPSGNSCFPVSPRKPPKQDLHFESLTPKTPETPENSHHILDETQITDYLLGLFIEFINPVHFFLTDSIINELRANDLKPELSLVKYAVMAAASLLADDEDSRVFGNDAAVAIDSVLLSACRQYPSTSLVQALAIMCWRELGLENHNMAWMYNSMSASLTVHLGLPVSSLHVLEDPQSEDSIEAKNMISKRTNVQTAWSAVMIDRIATSLLGRNCILPWKRIRAPSYLSLIAVPNLLELAFDSHCRLWFIFDQCMDKIYSFEFDSLEISEQHRLLLDSREQILSFKRNIDNHVQLRSSTSSPEVTILHMTYNMCQMLIHRPFLKDPTDSSTFRLSVRSMSIAAIEMVRLIREFEKVTQLDKAPLFVPHSIMTAAVTHLLNATSTQPTIRGRSIRHFRVCFNALISMQRRWVKARRFVSFLQDLAQRWAIMQALPLDGFPQTSSLDNEKPTESSYDFTSENISEELQGSSALDVEFENLLWANVDTMDLVPYQTELMDLHMCDGFEPSGFMTEDHEAYHRI